CFQGSHVPFTF
nr:immunoglobulin light chain junction region [Mus musculus]NSL97537.1 immunoglobulin light chain junction region [Mus musculus]NSL97958.1 immunoglobulin light chain junction region [Mus musculus]NSL98716.1 immunoglobulin light chain junction region [Mus musculus]NSL99117.1 immunoglobulin light chain junction region [Mus musculus]